jgi:CRISPR-associated protein Csd1
MMLKALYDLALRENLLDDPNYEKRRVDYFLRINEQGGYISLESTKDENGRAKEIPVPRMKNRAGSGQAPGFFFDNAKYILGLGGEVEDRSRNLRCFQSFYEVVQRVAEETKDAAAIAITAFGKRKDEFLTQLRNEGPKDAKFPDLWSGSENIAFILDSDNITPAHQRPLLRGAWSLQRQKGEAVKRCLVTGNFAQPAELHTLIKMGISPDYLQAKGAPFISFNNTSFESHGLGGNDNAPVSRDAAEGYAAGMNRLFEKVTVVIPATEKKKEVIYSRHRYGVTTGDNAVTVFWTREQSDFADLFSSGFDTTPAEAEALLQSIQKGVASTTNTNAFYAMTLGGNVSRIVVRDWFESTLSEIQQNILRYFEDLQLGPTERPLPLKYLLDALSSPGGQGVAPALGARFFQAALRNRPFPREVLGLALRRLRLPPKKEERATVLYARCAVIKAVLRRLPRPNQPEVTVSLDEQNTQIPYLLGRLFAVLERLQGEAQGDINTTIRDRYFGAASSTPSLVFPRLLRLSVHHAAKAERGGYFESIKGKIFALMPPAMPRLLSLEDQGLFAIGYYHQREWFWTKKPTETTNVS